MFSRKNLLMSLVLCVPLLSSCTSYLTLQKLPTASSPTDISVRPNVLTSFNTSVEAPQIDATAFVDPKSSVTGDVQVGHKVFIGPFASVRGDEGGPIFIGDGSNVQDGVVIHALETEKDGNPITANMVEKEGNNYAVYIGSHVSLAHQSQVHGPTLIENDVFVGMQSFVFMSKVGKGTVIEPGARLIGVTVAPDRYVPAGTTVTSQAEADKLPEISQGYTFYGINKKVLEVNHELAGGYKREAE